MITLRDEPFAYAKKKYKTAPEHLWVRYPDYAILRHGDNLKQTGPIGGVCPSVRPSERRHALRRGLERGSVRHAEKAGGQMLICVGGRGWYQEEGRPAVELTPGSVVNIPPNVKHWHGTAADSWFSHLAIEVAGENASTEWCEPVSNEEYNKLN